MVRLPLLVAALGLVACQGSPSGRLGGLSPPDGAPAPNDCSGCHGQNGNPMPPRAVDGSTSTQSIGVGAHAIHVQGTGIARPVPCSECHIVPEVADGIQHPDPLGGPAPLVFGLVATHDSASPVWDRVTRTCVDTFCHGNTLRGASTRPPPVWTVVDGSQRKCDSCHGYPPPGSHPQRADCETCHYAVVSAQGVVSAPLLHVDGVLQADTTISP
jgi:predicted CxxxxCH...CXXCH cytochrome family protein